MTREEGATWNSLVLGKGQRIVAVRSFFDGGVIAECNAQIKNKAGSAYVIQIAEIFEESSEKMKWTTTVEAARILPNDSSSTQAECTAAVEAARAICPAWLELEPYALI